MLDLSHYKLTDTEVWINNKYQKWGIHYASDLDIHQLAELFNIELHIYNGRSFADWSDESHQIILLNGNNNEMDRRVEFFHELCHPLRHAGDQGDMNKLFIDLQEVQAAQFQYYAAMPIYMIEEYWNDTSPSNIVKVLAEEFTLPERFVTRRLEQIKGRALIGQQDHEMSERMKSPVRINMAQVRRIMEEFGRRKIEREASY